MFLFHICQSAVNWCMGLLKYEYIYVYINIPMNESSFNICFCALNRHQNYRKLFWLKVLIGGCFDNCLRDGYTMQTVDSELQNGFKFHHAKTDCVMMIKWLPRDEECNIPPYAHTMIGVGAVVVNDKDEVLVVTEKSIHRPHWKLPGGYVEPGENLVDAAIREVYEETNIHTNFVNILTVRHTHGGQFGCSDLYTVVGLKPLSTEIKKCDREIAASQWMPIDEYLNHPHIHELNRFFVKKYIENKSENITIECTQGIHQVMNKPYTIYHASSILKDVNKKSL